MIKKTKRPIVTKVFAITIILFVCQGCWIPLETDDSFVDPIIDSAYEPVIISRAELQNSIAMTDAIAIGTSGKIYVRDNFLIVNELRKGFHIYDNSDPNDPKPLKFLKVPGATDLAIRENMFYINQATDLVAVQIDVAAATVAVTKRIPNTFPKLLSPDFFHEGSFTEDQVVVDWILKNK